MYPDSGMFRYSLACAIAISASLVAMPSNAGEWITEAEMKQRSREARASGALLEKISCRFQNVENPGREHVLFKPEFVDSDGRQPWGWTFDANAPNRNIEAQAKSSGFVVASEDYYEITGKTWVRCKVWHRP